MTHTPGPWDRQGDTVFRLDAHGRVNRFSAQVQGGYENGGQKFAFGDAPVRTSAGEIEANARLIAAAPELLEALEAAEKHIFDRAEASGYSPPVPGELVAIISHALAKARGAA